MRLLCLAMLGALPAILEAGGFEPCPVRNELGPRNAHAMVYDVGRARTILFGGADECQVVSDTWTWDGTQWSRLTTEGPSPRTFPGLAYDASHHQVVLYGGNAVLFGTETSPETFLGDTWILENDRWTERKVEGPGPRAEAPMAYDVARRRVVLFGGYRVVDDGLERERLGDTWEWDGSEWREVDDGGEIAPSPRNGASLAYSPDEGGVVLFGGNGPSGETWLWNGSVWRRLLDGSTTPGRFNPAMAFDPSTRHLLRFGGWNGERRVDDTYVLDERWEEVGAGGPSARNHTSMAADTARSRLVLFGGHDGELVFSDTWEWDGAEWLLVAPREAKRRIDNGH
jgi:hypothetical protein